jgi:NTP pyrophosphatase (non-canonical NTP hydrolase)
MENITKEQYREMVLRLAKPGEDILKSLTARDCDFMHMTFCLAGEAGELYDECDGPKVQNRKELVKELGDLVFYFVKLRSIFKTDWLVSPIMSEALNAPYNSKELMRLSCHLIDPMKRITIYRKDPHVPDAKYGGKHLADVIKELLDQIEGHLLAILIYFDIDIQEVLNENWKKLADTDTGRYASGTYSDEQAQNRRDEGSIVMKTCESKDPNYGHPCQLPNGHEGHHKHDADFWVDITANENSFKNAS